MPRSRDVELFKTSLRALGREPETLERWGEHWTESTPPDIGGSLPGDLPGSESGESADPGYEESAILENEATASPELDDTDFASFLDSIPLDEPEETLGAGSKDNGASSGENAGFPGLENDFGDLEVPDSFGMPAEPGFPGTIEEDDSSVPESLTAGLLDELEAIPDDATAEDFDFSDTLEPSNDAMELGSDAMELGGDAMELGGDAVDLGGNAMGSAGFQSGPEPKDSFDEFNLGGELALDATEPPELPEFESEDFGLGIGGSDDLDKQLAALDDGLPATENFNLESTWGGDFSIPGFEMGREDKKPAPKTRKDTAPQPDVRLSPRQTEVKIREVALTDNQVDALQDTLLSYPLNLRLAVEDILANTKGTEIQQAALVWKLVEGASARDAAKDAGKILKRYIAIPGSFEKRTGAAFEAEKGSFAYLFINSILPMLQVIVLAAAGAGLLFFLGYNFAYRPIRAHTLYSEGRRQIEQRRYREAEEYFTSADRVWIMKSWYYRYAESYAVMEEYPRAELMYERLLSRWPNETQAALDYARMVSGNLGFEKAEAILKTHILQRDYFNRDALLLIVDNYLAWASLEEQRYDGPRQDKLQKLYEDARFHLATLMERHGQSDAYLQRMLSYFIRTERAGGADKLKEVRGLANYFTGNPKSGFAPEVLAEMADYLMDRNETGQVGTILSSAIDRDGTLPETYVALAKWNRRSDFTADEVKALEFAIRFFKTQDEAGDLSPRRTKGYINSLIRLAELRMASGETLDASKNLTSAIQRYERALAERRFRTAPEFAKAYSLLADIYYRDWRDFPAALANYAIAESQGFTNPETDYRKGFIHYQDQSQGSMERALQLFYRAGLEREPSPYLLLATGNALFARSNYFAASGYYSMLVNRLQHELDTINLPRPQERRSHEEIVELLMVARNNLGVAKIRTAERDRKSTRLNSSHH